MGIYIGKSKERNVENNANKRTVTSPQPKSPLKPNSIYDNISGPSFQAKMFGYSIEKTNKNTRQINNTGTILQKISVLNNEKLNNLNEKQKLQFIQIVCGTDIREVSKMQTQEIDKIFDAVKSALKNCNSNNINVIAKLANSYYIAVKYGQWNSIEQFTFSQSNPKSRKESLSARLQRTGQNVDEYMEAQFGKNRSLIGKGKDIIKAKRAGMTVNEFKSKQSMQDLSKLVANSNKEEKFKLAEAIKHLEQMDNIDMNNRVNALRMIYASLSPAEKIEFSHKFVNDKELLRIAGADANRITIQGIEHYASKHMSEEDAIAHNINIDNSVTELESEISSIERELNSGNTTEAKKQSLLKRLSNLKFTLNNVYTPMQAGNITGSEANRNIVTEGVLGQIIANNVAHTNKMDVLSCVASYLTTHREEMRHSEEEFRELMDDITNGLYSMVEAKVNKEYEESLTAKNNYSTSESTKEYEYNNNNSNNIIMIPEPVIVENCDNRQQNVVTKKETVVAQASHYETEKTQNSSASTEHKKDVTQHNKIANQNIAKKDKTDECSNMGIVAKIKTNLESDKKGTQKWVNAINNYENCDTGTQVLILSSGLSAIAFNELIEHSKSETLKAFIASGNKGPNYEATKALEEHIKSLEKQENKQPSIC